MARRTDAAGPSARSIADRRARRAATGRGALYIAASAVLACSLAACRPSHDSARGAAEGFLDQHYVEMNLEKAKSFCTGLALEKVSEEQRLTQGFVIDEATLKPRVSYQLLEERPEAEDRFTLVYEGTITLDAADSFTRKWVVTARRDHAGWKVSNFSEF